MVSRLLVRGCTFATYPRLVRLNPNVPFKTRGNAAVCLEFETDDPEGAFEIAEGAVREMSDTENGANSGLVFVDRPSAFDFRGLYLSAVSGLVSYRGTLARLAERGVRRATLGNGMGIVGAAASLGFREEDDDHTFELIAYRTEASCGRERRVEAGSVKRMELATFPRTFNSFDHRTRRVLLTPHGPDPVFLGVRADDPSVALSAFGMLRFEEELAGHVVYLSNQCTDAHLKQRLGEPLKAYSSGWLEGTVDALEKAEGGHLYLDLRVAGPPVRAAVYRPSADLRRAAELLERGDLVRVFGGVRRATSRHPPILNVEKLEVLALSPLRRRANPLCPGCARVAKSEGRGKGFQCRRCGARFGEDAVRTVARSRSLVPGVYLPPPGAQRHLTKPLVRYGRELHGKRSPLVDGWFWLGPSGASPAPDQSPLSGPRGPLSPRTP